MKNFMMCLFIILSCCGLRAQSSTDIPVSTGVDTYPKFRGGVRGWNNFVQQSLNLRDVVNSMDSTTYVDYGLKQTAILEFTVCEDGKICDVEILNKNKISPEFADEAMRIMRKSPRWTPARKDGKTVNTRFKQSITAVLN